MNKSTPTPTVTVTATPSGIKTGNNPKIVSTSNSVQTSYTPKPTVTATATKSK
jgi:hypothetical protein